MAFLFPKLFPNCLPEAANGTFEMPLEDAMAFIWKAKTFSFTMSLSIIGFGNNLVLTNTLNANGTFFLTLDDGALNPQPLEKMSDIACGGDIFRGVDGTNFDAGGAFGLLNGSGILNDEGFVDTFGARWSVENWNIGPSSVRSSDQRDKICDFALDILLDPFFLDDGSNWSISTNGPYDEDEPGALVSTIPDGASITVNGNTYSTDLYLTSRGLNSGGYSLNSQAGSGSISIEVESERLAE